ncbi:MAG: hypothetical protein B6I24_06120 [Bacteroidetes bacterium 4572_128]|nr:MAG: hypothetical protein B6I24_06120 [Bacteroidetes bacterium 4572_128]
MTKQRPIAFIMLLTLLMFASCKLEETIFVKEYPPQRYVDSTEFLGSKYEIELKEEPTQTNAKIEVIPYETNSYRCMTYRKRKYKHRKRRVKNMIFNFGGSLTCLAGFKVNTNNEILQQAFPLIGIFGLYWLYSAISKDYWTKYENLYDIQPYKYDYFNYEKNKMKEKTFLISANGEDNSYTSDIFGKLEIPLYDFNFPSKLQKHKIYPFNFRYNNKLFENKIDINTSKWYPTYGKIKTPSLLLNTDKKRTVNVLLPIGTETQIFEKEIFYGEDFVKVKPFKDYGWVKYNDLDLFYTMNYTLADNNKTLLTNSQEIAFQNAVKENMLYQFIYNYPNSKQIDKANKLVFQNAKSENTIEAYTDFIEDASNKDLISTAFILRSDIVFNKLSTFSTYDEFDNFKQNNINIDINKAIYTSQRKNGKLILWSNNGQKISEGNYKNNLKHGKWLSLNECGKEIYKGTYNNGKVINFEEYKYFEDDCNKIHIYYIRKMSKGTLIVYYKSGKKKTYIESLNSKPYKEIGYYENGNKQYFYEIKNGKLHGKCISYYHNGRKKIELNSKNGVGHGLFTEYHNNGVKSKQGNMKNGKADGRVEYWNKNGNLYKTENYKNGYCTNCPNGLSEVFDGLNIINNVIKSIGGFKSGGGLR